jgi:5-formyltetrahydrofolate cyclo-ligase
VDYIVTPDELIPCPDRRRPEGLVWDDLTAEKIAAIPVLAEQATARPVHQDRERRTAP